MTAIHELTRLDDLLAMPPSENFSWHVADREPLPDDEPAHAESGRAAWLHQLYTFQQKQISQLQARAWETLQQIRGLPDPPLPAGSTLPAKAAPDAYEAAESELMARNKVSRRQADHRLDEAHRLTGLPKILARVRAGLLPDGHARHIARKLPGTGDPALDAERRRRVEDQIADVAADMTTRRLTYAISKIVNEIDPDATRKEHEREKSRTHVRTWQDFAGMGMVEARLTDEAVAVIDTVLDLLANAARNAAHREQRPLEEVGATHGQRRANAFAGIFAAVLNGTALHTVDEDGVQVPAWWQPPALPTRKRRRPHLVLTIDTATLLGHDDLAGDLLGYGAISPDLARKIATECGTIDLLHTGTTGTDTDTDTDTGTGTGTGTEILRTTSYAATARIHSRIGARYRTCRFPHCDHPAYDCDSDHVDPHSRGGRTSTTQMIPLCRRHHRMKTHGGWTTLLQADGTVVWTSPTGGCFRVPPP